MELDKREEVYRNYKMSVLHHGILILRTVQASFSQSDLPKCTAMFCELDNLTLPPSARGHHLRP